MAFVKFTEGIKGQNQQIREPPSRGIRLQHNVGTLWTRRGYPAPASLQPYYGMKLSELEILQKRVNDLEHIFRQVEGTIAVFVAHKKITFSNPQSKAAFNEILKKWREEYELPPGHSNTRRPHKAANSRVTATSSLTDNRGRRKVPA